MRISLRFPAAIITLAALSACGGAGGAPPTQSAFPAAGAPTSPMGWFEPAACTTGRLKLDKCSVHLTKTDPKATVTATGPKGGTISFTDKTCTDKKTAEVTGSDGKYVVTAGIKAGHCAARFMDIEKKKVLGTGVLAIENTL